MGANFSGNASRHSRGKFDSFYFCSMWLSNVNHTSSSLTLMKLSPTYLVQNLFWPRSRRAVIDPLSLEKCYCVSHAVQGETYDTLTPLQVSVGVKSGCKAIVHAVSSVLEDESIAPGHRWTLLADFTNVFNSIDWESMRQEVRACCIPTMSLTKEDYPSPLPEAFHLSLEGLCHPLAAPNSHPSHSSG